MTPAYQRSREEVVKAVDVATDPSRITREEYKDLLSDLITDLQMRLDAATEEDG